MFVSIVVDTQLSAFVAFHEDDSPLVTPVLDVICVWLCNIYL